MIEIEFIGTGGQGSVVAGRLLADAAARAGYKTQAFSAYGAQRRGGNVESYVRLSSDTIRNHSKIYGADLVIVMDKALLERSLRDGKLKQGSTVLINTDEAPEKYPALKGRKVITLDANRIASRRGVTLPSGTPVINTTVLGALWAMIPSVKMDQLLEALKEGKIPAVEKNIAAVQEAYEAISQSLGGATTREIDKTPVIVDLLPEYSPRLAPCEAYCPAGEKIERTALFVRYGHFEDALENIKAENPFPGICGRVCFHPCEQNCNRSRFDAAVSANALERAAFDHANSTEVRKPEKKPSTGKTVAVIGSGPAGMTCAYYLGLLGHKVTVFESQPVAGGVPRFGIPEYHLPRKIVDHEIQEIRDIGVAIRLNCTVGKDIPFDDIRREHDACLIAVGAHRSGVLGVPGEDAPGVYQGLDFLRRVALGEKVAVGKRVVVVGGGNVAMDVARTARRLGAAEVYCASLESREEMPAYAWEIDDAAAEGVQLRPGWGPKKIVSTAGNIVAVELMKCVSVYDSKKKFAPKYDQTDNTRIDCDTVITAIGDRVEPPFPEGFIKMSGQLIEVDGLGMTSKAGVFAGGDATSMARSVVEAIASGKRAALGIDLYLNKGTAGDAAPFMRGSSAVSMGRYLSGDQTRESDDVVPFEKLNLAYFTEEPRVKIRSKAVSARLNDFGEVKRGFSKQNAMAEADRCFHCGTCFLCEVCYISCPELAVTLTDDGPTFSQVTDVCKSCGICLRECPRHAISWEGVAND